MESLENDIERAKQVITHVDKEERNNCDHLLSTTTDAIDEILKDVDVKGKNIFSCMAAIDQVFSFYYADANLVDTFDKNALTEYFYYLKKWSVTYLGDFMLYGKSDEYLNNLLYSINPNTEKEEQAKDFWVILLKTYKSFLQRDKMKFDRLTESDLFAYNPEIFDLEYMKDITKLNNVLPRDINFYTLNIFEKIKTIPRKYDIVYISNILEFARRTMYYENCVENMKKLLKDKGSVICTKIVLDAWEKPYFEKDFTISEDDDYVVYTKK